MNTGNMGTLSLGDMVHRFKAMTTKRYTDGVKQSGWPSFPGKLWQRNYWEHIIRDEMELNRKLRGSNYFFEPGEILLYGLMLGSLTAPDNTKPLCLLINKECPQWCNS